ncbi:hypothetical protein Arth_4489 (plasmid) [Arthrobacter sp. FB24]|uniref:hypothetical protein n=1 Tax=Arthrobacter sp. (strain FB24) TaxID=290399 RepID=UPI0000526CBF|nr:hypothetical protein [Arthrobacter sp. FB24]ABK05658.1 hypothetical protein Arth_4489 [Arthrobacter sp. FB24]
MTGIPETGRQAANVLLDAVSLWDEKPDPELINRALARLGIIGAVQARGPAAADLQGIDIDVTHLVGGATVAIKWLVAQLAAARGVEESSIISELRHHFDT